jgi:hypothetical protein
MTRLVDRYQFAAKIALLSSAGLCPGYASAGASRRSGACVASHRWLGRKRRALSVTGFRSSLKSALDAKRKDIRISDGISSEDIGKFPAENITEAIQRIAGVQMSNINGRGSTISIRGLGAQYARTTINGQTFASADFKTASATTSSRPIWPASRCQVAHRRHGHRRPVGHGQHRYGPPAGLQGPALHPDCQGLRQHLSRRRSRPRWAAPISTALPMAPGRDGQCRLSEVAGSRRLLFIDRWTTPTASDGSTVYSPKRFRYRRIDRNTEQLMASGRAEYRPSDNFEALFQGEFSRDHTTYNTQQLVFGKFGDSNITVNHVTAGVADSIAVASVGMDNNDQLERATCRPRPIP